MFLCGFSAERPTAVPTSGSCSLSGGGAPSSLGLLSCGLSRGLLSLHGGPSQGTEFDVFLSFVVLLKNVFLPTGCDRHRPNEARAARASVGPQEPSGAR